MHFSEVVHKLGGTKMKMNGNSHIGDLDGATLTAHTAIRD
jgi:hypothetical protein